MFFTTRAQKQAISSGKGVLWIGYLGSLGSSSEKRSTSSGEKGARVPPLDSIRNPLVNTYLVLDFLPRLLAPGVIRLELIERWVQASLRNQALTLGGSVLGRISSRCSAVAASRLDRSCRNEMGSLVKESALSQWTEKEKYLLAGLGRWSP